MCFDNIENVEKLRKISLVTLTPCNDKLTHMILLRTYTVKFVRMYSLDV